MMAAGDGPAVFIETVTAGSAKSTPTDGRINTFVGKYLEVSYLTTLSVTSPDALILGTLSKVQIEKTFFAEPPPPQSTRARLIAMQDTISRTPILIQKQVSVDVESVEQ